MMTGRFGPGSLRPWLLLRMLDIAFRATPARALTHVAAPVMHELAIATNQSCHLVVRGAAFGMVVQRQENIGAVGLGMRLGATIDLVTSCSWHVLLAFAPAARRVSVEAKHKI